MEIYELAKFCAEVLASKKAKDVRVLNLKELTTFTDYFVICSAESRPHARALVQELERKLKEADIRKFNVEGLQNFKWILVDLFDVVVHILLPESRDFYRIEDYWGDAEVEIISQEAERSEGN